jgi:hypothetical protein
MPLVLNLLLRAVLLVAGLVAALSLAAATVAVLALWSLRAGWARLTGRPVAPPAMRWRRAAAARTAPRARPAPAWAPVAPGRRGARPDVTDVEPK